MQIRHRNLLFYCFIFLLTNSLHAQLVINEVCSKNNSILPDDFGEYSDWIEIHNVGLEAINLDGYFLSDKVDNPQKWHFPSYVILPNEYLVIFASNKDVSVGDIHTNFKLSSSGESIILSNQEDEEIDLVKFPKILTDHSFGRIEGELDQWSFFETPTPSEFNNATSAYQYAKSPEFANNTQFVDTETSVEITCSTPDCVIRFTRDGRLPDENSEVYTEAIKLDTTTCLRIRAFDNGDYPSPVVTRTFFVNTEHTLPILAMTSEPDYFWEWENGIFRMGPEADTVYPYYGANFWKDIEIPLHIEYFEDGFLQINKEVSAEIHGGRAARNQPMKALRLLTDSDVPSDGMSHQFFKNKDIHNFRRLVVRNASGDYNYTHFRDAYAQRYMINEKLDIDVLAHQPMAVYINGIYWGVMNMREKIDKFYIEENHGYTKKEIDILEEDLFVVQGVPDEYLENYDFVINNDLSIAENYNIAASYFDIPSLFDFFIAQSFLNNTDWPDNNLKFWQPQKEGGKWRYLLFDLDVSMGRHGWTQAFNDNFSRKLENERENKFIYIVLAFLENEGFRNQFINRYCDLMNTTFREELFLAETERTVAEIDEEMERHFEKWGWPGYDKWKNNRVEKLYSFILDRPMYQREFIRDYFDFESIVNLQFNVYPPEAGVIKLNTIELDSFPWNGYYYQGVPVEVEVIPNTGFSFSHWESLYHFDQDGSKQWSFNFTGNDEITAYFDHDDVEHSIQAKPNPFLLETEIAFTLESQSEVEVEIRDITGKLFYNRKLGLKNGGNHIFTLDQFPSNSGVYFVVVKSDFYLKSVKVVKMETDH